MKAVLLSLLCLFVFSSVVGGTVTVDESSYPHIFITADVSYADLDNSGVLTLYDVTSGTATYRIFSIATASGDSTSFTVGNRNLHIGTSGEARWTVSAASLAQVGSTSLTSESSGTGINPASSYNALSNTAAGADIIVKYTGGTTDYTGGSTVLHIVLFQTAQ